MITDTPTLDTLRAHKLAYEVGATAAERCQALLPTIYSGAELERLSASYTRRADDFRMALAIVDAQIASLPSVPIDALTALRARRRQCEAMIDRKPAERRVWADKAMRVQAKIEQIEAGL